jgi:hypothetical protein
VSDQTPRVLVIGGAGVFGWRLVVGLLERTSFEVIIVGRDEARLATAIRRGNAISGRIGRTTALRLDAREITADLLRSIHPFAVVDAAGPFQGGDYRLAETAIAAGIHYIDLADGRDFVAGFDVLDTAAKQSGVVALTGASTTPALTNAVLDRLTAGWRALDHVEIAISPGNRAPRGLSVVQSILSYAGRPIRVFDGQQWCIRPGWGMTIRRRMVGVGRRWLSLVDTPDLDIIPTRFSVRNSVLFRAGLEMPLLHLGLLAASLPVRLGVVRSLTPLARLFRSAAARFKWFGTDRGGMTVEATGFDQQGNPVRAIWSLVAEAGDGPFVPTLPAVAVLRALVDRRITRPGASACVGVISLEDIEAEFTARRIATSTSSEHLPGSLYRVVLGTSFDLLPEPLRRMHSPAKGLIARGVARVDGADRLIGRIVAAMFGLPAAGENLPVSVKMTPAFGQERWTRDFGGKRFESVLSTAAMPNRLIERFGPFSFVLDVPVGPSGVLGMPIRAWRLGPIPLPRFLAPLSTATEDVDNNGRFRFDVEMRLPLGLGRLVRYRGYLVPDSALTEVDERN